MKRLILLIAPIILMTSLYAQDAQVFNRFKYIYLPPLTYQNGGIDIYGISSEVMNYFQEKGFGILANKRNPNMLNQELKNNPCIVVTCHIEHPNSSMWTNSVTLKFYDCQNQLVYLAKGSGAVWTNLAGSYKSAVSKALKEFRNCNYAYDPKLTPKVAFPDVEMTTETEASLKEYFASNRIDLVEGIYKSYQSDQLGFYEFGIKKYGNIYKAIIIDSEYNHWQVGEVKATFEQSSMKGFYSTTWYKGNKTSYETFAQMENEAMLSVEFKDPTTNEKRVSKFIKMYPMSSVEASSIQRGIIATASGFVISSDGVIATNAHVIQNAKSIEVLLSNEMGTVTYIVDILLKDEVNDVALLKISDSEFQGFNDLPFKIFEETEVGEWVYTIGYPLNTVMGDNYKVTNGIISSLSGVADDVRFLQITVPVQPGNSGGPLFNEDGNIIGITSARLNEEAIGMSVENVNYAIKSSYLLNLYKMLPERTPLSVKSTLEQKELKDQIKVLKNYVCLIRVC